MGSIPSPRPIPSAKYRSLSFEAEKLRASELRYAVGGCIVLVIIGRCADRSDQAATCNFHVSITSYSFRFRFQ